MKLSDLWFRVRTLIGLSQAERELKEEFAFHLEMERKKLVRDGMTDEAARQEASRRFGGMTRERQRARDQWGIGLVRDLASDVRHAFRQFARRPAFTVAGTLTLAIGIGATISLFSVVRGTLLRPLPVTRESELHVFWSDYDWRGSEFDFLRDRALAFSGLTAYSVNSYTLTVGDAAVTTLSGVVSAEFFDVLGAAPQFGRTFEKGDDRPGAEPRVVLGHALWQRVFGGDSGIVGKRVTLDGAQFTVIGVMPKSFYFPTPEIEMWRPLSLDPSLQAYAGNGWLVLIGRAKPGASPPDITHNIQSMAADLGKQFAYPAAWDKSKNAHTTLVREYLLGNVAPVLLLLLGAVVTLLLMACANVAALVLSRTADRTPEMVLRSALGAGRGRLARQIIAESLAMSTLSGAMGVVLAVGTFGVLLRRIPLRDGLASTLHVDWSMFAGAIALAAIVGLVVAAVPVRTVLMGALSGVSGDRSSAGMRGGHKRFHTAMVAVEMGLGVTLAAGALLLVRSVSHVYAQDTGFNPSGVVALDILLSRDVPQPARQLFLAALTERARAVPGVKTVGFVNRLPVRDGGGQGTIQSASRPDIAPPAAPNTFFRFITPGYFEAMGITMVHGRAFTDADRTGAPPVAIVSESFAKRMWPDKDPIGQLIASAGATNPTWTTVVGVAKETRLYKMVGDNPLGLYLPIAQAGLNAAVLVAKTTGNTAAAMAALREVVHQTDRRAAVGRVITMNDVVAVSLADRLQLRFFLSILATLALVLGAIGVYGVVSYAVSRRRAEFGVRLALGATSGRVLREVAEGGLKPVAIGVIAGVVASAFLSRFVSGFLYGVQPRDVLSIGGAALALLAAGVAAVIIPGVRAGRTSPVEVLRGE